MSQLKQNTVLTLETAEEKAKLYALSVRSELRPFLSLTQDQHDSMQAFYDANKDLCDFWYGQLMTVHTPPTP